LTRAFPEAMAVVMSVKKQLVGLNAFLTEIYRSDMRLSKLLAEFGLEQQEIELLRDKSLRSLLEEFLAVIKERLGERRFEIVSRRFGLDGERPDTLQALGNKLSLSRERVRQLEESAIRRCRSKKTLSLFTTRLNEIAREHLKSSPEVAMQRRTTQTEQSEIMQTLVWDGTFHPSTKPLPAGVQKARANFARAYESWSTEEDELLKQQFDDGLSMKDLAKFFERNEGAIQSRLKKLGLVK
jgi:hypothetical protein